MKDEDHAVPRQDVPKNELTSPELVGGEFIKNPLEFAIAFYLASQYQAIPPLQNLADVISTVNQAFFSVPVNCLTHLQHQQDATEATGHLATALLEIVPLLGSKSDNVLTVLASCGG